MPSPTFLGRIVELEHGQSLPDILSQGMENLGSVAVLAERHGVSKRTLYRWVRKHGIETPRNPGRKRKAVAPPAVAEEMS